MAVRSPSVPRSPVHHPTRSPGTAPYSRHWHDQAAIGRREDSWSAGRSGSPCVTSLTRMRTRSQALSLLSIARLNKTRSRMRPLNCRRTRMAQISFRFSGGFWPVIFPLFQGMRTHALVSACCIDRLRSKAERRSHIVMSSGAATASVRNWWPSQQGPKTSPLSTRKHSICCDGPHQNPW